MIATTARPSPRARNSASPRVRSIELHGPAGKLEAVVNEGSPEAPFAALVCHPHPLGGGTMHNKVVYRAMKALHAPEWGLRWPVLRFNFRGFGRSHGTYDGTAEADDVLAALRWLENEYNRPIIAAGFSFGAAMVLRACCTQTDRTAAPLPVRALLAIGLPLRSGWHAKARIYDYSFTADCPLPKLFLSGDHDQFAPRSELIQAVASAAQPKHLALVPGADHFFTGHLEPMQSALSGWLKEHVL